MTVSSWLLVSMTAIGEEARAAQSGEAERRRPHFAPRRRTSASLTAPPARFAHTATAYGNAESTQAPLAEATALDQKRVKPRLEERVDVDVAEGRGPSCASTVSERKRDHATGKPCPGAGGRCAVLARARPALTPGFSAGESRNQAYQTAAQITPSRRREKRRTPSIADLDRHDQQRRDGAANLAGHQQDAGHARALGRGEPARHDNRRVRKRASFPGAEAESRQQEQGVVRHRAGQRRERRPPQHHARQDAARADAIPSAPVGISKMQ